MTMRHWGDNTVIELVQGTDSTEIVQGREVTCLQHGQPGFDPNHAVWSLNTHHSA